MGDKNGDNQKKEPVSPLNIEEQDFDEVMRKMVRVPPHEKEKNKKS